LDGEIVGINTAIRSSTGEFSGVAFSIPSNMAKPVMADLAKFGRVRRGYLGIHMDQLQADQLQKLGLKNGVVIQGMTPGETPARKAGLLESDVIVEVDGKPVTTTRQLQDMVVQSNGKTLNVKVRRTGKGEISIPVTIDEQPDDFGPQLVASRIREREPEPEREEIKLEVSPVESLGIEVAQHDEGLLIASVTKGSLADQFGLQPGTVILSAEGKPVRSAPELVAAIDAADPAKGAMLRVQDGDGNVRFEVIRKVEP
jgi:serine protease Do